MNTTQKTSGFYKTQDGAELYYEIRGEGEPVVFIYGIACLLNHWHHQLYGMATGWKTYGFDLRGHQQSTRGSSDKLTVRGLAEDLVELFDFWKISKAHLVGHSFGVPIAIQAYELMPERICSLALINGFAQNPIQGMFGLEIVEPVYKILRKAYDAQPEIFKWSWQHLVDNPVSMLLASLAGGFNIQLTQIKDIEVYARGVASLDLEVFLTLFDDMMKFDGYAIAKSIQVPTLIMAGEKDSVTPFHFQEKLHHSIAGSELVPLPYGSHCCQLDFPDYVNLRLEKHFKGQLKIK